jgi:hypothetical protein
MPFAELIPIIQTLPQHEKLQLIKILQDEVSVLEDISPLEHHKTYWISTPINSFGTAGDLMRAMQEEKSRR